MKALLDTHAFLWAAVDPNKLSVAARQVCESAELFLSAASIWEITIKFQIGRLQLPDSPRAFIAEQLRLGEINVLPITASHALRVSDLALAHRDPFDRMLASQSIEEQMPLITRDPQFRTYQVNTIW